MSPSQGNDYPSPREIPPKPIPPKPNFSHNALFEAQLTQAGQFKLPDPKRTKVPQVPAETSLPIPRQPEVILQEIQEQTRNTTAPHPPAGSIQSVDCQLPPQLSGADKYTLEGKRDTAVALSLPALTTLSETIHTPPANSVDINITSSPGTYHLLAHCHPHQCHPPNHTHT